MRYIGLLLLVLGTAVAGTYGAQLAGHGDADVTALRVAEAHGKMARKVAALHEAGKLTADSPLLSMPAPATPVSSDGEGLQTPRGTDALSDWSNRAGLPFAGGIVLIVIGVLLSRAAIRSDDEPVKASGETSNAVADLEALVAGLRKDTAAVYETHGQQPPTELLTPRAAVERIQHTWCEPLVERRQALINRFGMAGYAEIFVAFSACERNLNRAWSTLVDGYVDETGPSLQRAARAAEDTWVAWRKHVPGDDT